jgi:hypothetical protein
MTANRSLCWIILLTGLSTACGVSDPDTTVRFRGEAVDPAGDHTGQDLVRASIEVVGRAATFRAEFTQATFSPDISNARFSLDVDQSAATGEVRSDLNGIGTDFIVDLGRGRGGVRVLQYINGQYEEISNNSFVSVEDNALETSFLLALMADDGAMRFKVTAFSTTGPNTFSGIQDYLTNVGVPPVEVR